MMEKNQFKQALDVWAQFFISPLMKENTVEREINAVDSEFDLARQDDWCRKLFIMQVRSFFNRFFCIAFIRVDSRPTD